MSSPVNPTRGGPPKGPPVSICLTTKGSLLDPEQKLQPQRPKATDHQYQTEQATSHAIPNTEGSSSVHTVNTMEWGDTGNPKKCPSPSTAQKTTRNVFHSNLAKKKTVRTLPGRSTRSAVVSIPNMGGDEELHGASKVQQGTNPETLCGRSSQQTSHPSKHQAEQPEIAEEDHD